MSRPDVSVVMPFSGDAAAARAALQTLSALATQSGDELILADNSSTADAQPPPVAVVRAKGERSPAHARNVGAEQAHNDWILFLDADCVAPADLLDRYFGRPVADEVGALAGEVVAAPGGDTLVARYGAARAFLGQRAHVAHPFLPRAVAANLLVRKAAFQQIGGFYEGVRAAEDTDFSWRLQEAGWRLELRPEAQVAHRYRTTLTELRRQWRGYAAGRAWLARRYEGFEPEPALRRATHRGWRRVLDVLPTRHGEGEIRRSAPPAPHASRVERGQYLALDALLSAEELAGLALSNRPPRHARPQRHDRAPAHVVIVADRFPAAEDPLVEFARTLDGARVEAAARPEVLDVEMARALQIEYREDDGAAARAVALAALAIRHPVRLALDVLKGPDGGPKLSALAPAIRRVERDTNARVHALGADHTRATARRIANLAGRPLEE